MRLFGGILFAHELHLPKLALLASRVTQLLAVQGLAMRLHMGAALRAKLADAVRNNFIVDLPFQQVIGAVKHALQDLLLFNRCMPSIVLQSLLDGVSALVKSPACAAFALAFEICSAPRLLLIHSRISQPEQTCDLLVRFWRNY